MKTSFYFVLWILIYPILGLFHNSFIDNNAFIVALAIVWGLSWLLNRMMPDTLTYERASQVAPILEDVYTCNVASFKKRLVRESNIETVTAIYFIVTTIVIALAIFKAGVNDWIALVIFGFFTYGAISRSISLIRAKAILKSNPTSEQCMEIADETYKLDYASYYDARNGVSYQDMFPPKPKYFKALKVFFGSHLGHCVAPWIVIYHSRCLNNAFSNDSRSRCHCRNVFSVWLAGSILWNERFRIVSSF